jgi:hypothetical protein
VAYTDNAGRQVRTSPATDRNEGWVRRSDSQDMRSWQSCSA